MNIEKLLKLLYYIGLGFVLNFHRDCVYLNGRCSLLCDGACIDESVSLQERIA